MHGARSGTPGSPTPRRNAERGIRESDRNRPSGMLGIRGIFNQIIDIPRSLTPRRNGGHGIRESVSTLPSGMLGTLESAGI